MAENQKWNGAERREDQCAAHCYLKKNIIELEDKVKKSAPLWSLVLMIGLLVSTATYSFTENSKIKGELHARITTSNDKVMDELRSVSSTVSKIEARQEMFLKAHDYKEQNKNSYNENYRRNLDLK